MALLGDELVPRQLGTLHSKGVEGNITPNFSRMYDRGSGVREEVPWQQCNFMLTAIIRDNFEIIL
jgi:hypothetical protein